MPTTEGKRKVEGFDYLLSTKQVAWLFGVPYRTLDRWVRRGVLPKPRQPARGTGSSRGWSLTDALRAAVVAFLRAQLFPLPTAKEAVAILSDLWEAQHQDPLAETLLFFMEDKVFHLPNREVLVDMLVSHPEGEVLMDLLRSHEPRKTVWLFDIAKLVEAALQPIATLVRLIDMAVQSEERQKQREVTFTLERGS